MAAVVWKLLVKGWPGAARVLRSRASASAMRDDARRGGRACRRDHRAPAAAAAVDIARDSQRADRRSGRQGRSPGDATGYHWLQEPLRAGQRQKTQRDARHFRLLMSLK